MSRVVPDQKGKFETDELFVSVSRPTEIVYTGLLCGTEEERRRQFLRDCLDRHLSLAFLHSGLNLELDMTGGGDSSQAADALDLDSDPVKVFISSCMILNGVCVRLRGWIDRITLKGTALLEFDPVHADIERQRIVSLGSATHPTSTRPLLMFTSTSAGIVQGPSNYPSSSSTTGNSVRSPHAFLAPSTSHSIRPTSTGSRND
ncbi:Protein brother [Trichinella pseudospiralis]|uniref:Protein brother n=1 Tax=Trichinella pseudospiralis TaxID=6337 RepID=A0A0V1E5S8_TRIPS|nr:Protein brother [Trichinella pseudospiralis]KRY69002.1 Protein brother [Trichinella pseudospiralis]KRZ08104.1 Protein brother [Trichinella pseudospiralis]KRZ36406.1 Protein brother [Trichinella pseudospiralis]